jgi:hypothetical protein
VIEAAQIINFYVAPLPGSTFFSMPGTALSNAKNVVDSFIEEPASKGMSSGVARALVDHLTYYFDVAERPLRHPERRALVEQLSTVALANRFDLEHETRNASPAEPNRDTMEIIDAITAAEKRRAECIPPKKRSSVVAF